MTTRGDGGDGAHLTPLIARFATRWIHMRRPYHLYLVRLCSPLSRRTKIWEGTSRRNKHLRLRFRWARPGRLGRVPGDVGYIYRSVALWRTKKVALSGLGRKWYQKTYKYMLPKRRFWKAEQTFQYAFSKDFSTLSPKSCTDNLEKCFENYAPQTKILEGRTKDEIRIFD
jgi:hypothetical protein